MDKTFTLTIAGNSSVLEAEYIPPIELSSNKNYVLGIVELLTFNPILNVDIGKNKFYIGNQVVTIAPGSYEIKDVKNYIKMSLANGDFTVVIVPTKTDKIKNNVQKNLETASTIISITSNNNTLHSEIKSNRGINFKPKDSIGELLGFTPRVLVANKTHTSNSPVAILKVNTLRIECNITTGAFINNRKVHTSHEVFPTVPPGYNFFLFSNENFFLTSSNMYLNICEKSLTSVFIFCFKENWEKVPFLKVLDKETPLIVK